MFSHLHCHSYYSFLRGTASPAALARRAAELGMEALALTDRNNVSGAVEFYLACREAGIKPILGVELTENNIYPGETGKNRSGRLRGRSRRAVFLARNLRGWERICEITTSRQLDADFSLPRTVREAGGEIVIITDSPSLIPTPHPRKIFLEVTSYMRLREREEIFRIGREKKIPLTAANNVYFLSPDDHPLARLLTCIRTRSTWKEVSPGAAPHSGAWLKSVREMEDSLGEYPDTFLAAARIAAECELTMELGKLHLPRYPLAPGENAPEHLRTLCLSGARRRYGGGGERMKRRLEKELGVINRL
ncbi:MAG: PHP domain-containing protein, partial [Candidatus Auribacterota bacterium]|nr:PHP domain-containing protein [Candidatus Auribacterota bacterium]